MLSKAERIAEEVRKLLKCKFEIDHSTIELETEDRNIDKNCRCEY